MSFTSTPKVGAHSLFHLPALDVMGMVHAWSTPASAAYTLANLALFVPFSVSVPCTVYEGWVSTGATAGGNFDIGVYDVAGARLTSSGATARTASITQNTTTMTNLDLLPDRYYYMAFAADATSNYFSIVPAPGLLQAQGALERTSSYVLPADASSFVLTTRAYLPSFGLNLKATAF